MSQWTHVCGCIRYDALRIAETPLNTLNEIKRLVDQLDVPRGSEGPIEFAFWENPRMNAIAAFSVAVFGDLRDFGSENVDEIRQWFARITTSDGIMVRNAILEITVEGTTEPIILRKGDD